jgi:hypothetical protein
MYDLYVVFLSLVIVRWLWRLLKLSIGITADATGIDVPLSCTTIGFRRIISGTGRGLFVPVPDLFRHRHLFLFRTGITECRTFRHSDM